MDVDELFARMRVWIWMMMAITPFVMFTSHGNKHLAAANSVMKRYWPIEMMTKEKHFSNLVCEGEPSIQRGNEHYLNDQEGEGR